MTKTPRTTPVPIAGQNLQDKNSAQDAGTDAAGKVQEIDSEFAGQRKLIRPALPENATLRDNRRRGFGGILTRRAARPPAAGVQDSGQTEGFYFQKQMQSQTQMVFVLEDGEQVEGYIEWYDRNCIKVRNNGRVLIYKSAIKYLYKASERRGEWPMTLV